MGKKILLIDDEAEFNQFLKSALEERGYNVIAATSAVEGGLYLGKERPDILIMDIRMYGINGFEACQAIKNNPETANIPIFIISALSSSEDIELGLKAGATKYFTKPLNLEVFLREIASFLK